MLVAVPPGAQQRGNQPAPAAAAAQDRPAQDRPATPIPQEAGSVTSHEVTIGGQSIRYKATAGHLLIRGDDDQPNASVFYVAYTLDGVTDADSVGIGVAGRSCAGRSCAAPAAGAG